LPKKQHRDSPKKIDGIDALILAMSGAVVRPDAKSIYDRPELFEALSSAPQANVGREFAFADDDDW